MRVAAVQLSSQDDVDANLERVSEAVARAAAGGARLVLLPENFAYFGTEAGKRAVAESLRVEGGHDGPIAARLRALSEEHGVWLLAGGMPERSDEPERPYNTCAVFDPKGRLAARYRKLHLFDVELGAGGSYRESSATTAGDEVACVTIPGEPELVVGLTVCYDVRFPELYRRLVDRGASLVVVPAAFTQATGKDHWLVLLRARAIESQAYVLAAAQWGRHGERLTFGKSCLIDPWGEVVAQASEGVGLVFGELDLPYLAEVRRRLPSLEHRVLR
jgi:predicted amidohydrolase